MFATLFAAFLVALPAFSRAETELILYIKDFDAFRSMQTPAGNPSAILKTLDGTISQTVSFASYDYYGNLPKAAQAIEVGNCCIRGADQQMKTCGTAGACCAVCRVVGDTSAIIYNVTNTITAIQTVVLTIVNPPVSTTTTSTSCTTTSTPPPQPTTSTTCTTSHLSTTTSAMPYTSTQDYGMTTPTTTNPHPGYAYAGASSEESDTTTVRSSLMALFGAFLALF